MDPVDVPATRLAFLGVLLFVVIAGPSTVARWVAVTFVVVEMGYAGLDLVRSAGARGGV